MKNWKVIVRVLSGILLLLLVIWGMTIDKDRPFKKNPVDKTSNIIYNETNMVYLDTILYVGLKYLNIKNIVILVKPLSSALNITILSDSDFSICTLPIYGSTKVYIIFTKKMSRASAIHTLSHELIHIKQFIAEDLKIENTNLIWKGDTISVKTMEYRYRPWEAEAYKYQERLKRQILKDLY